MKLNQLFLKPAIILAVFGALAFSLQAEALTIYSSRSEHLIKPFFDEFTKESGVEVRYIIDKPGVLIERLRREGYSSPADILLTVDAGNLWLASQHGLLSPTRDSPILQSIPRSLKDRKNRWFALTIRARTIIFNKNNVSKDQLSTYQQLADDVWRGRLCLRTSKKVYNQSMVAMMIDRYGESKTEQIVRGWVDNLAAEPFAKDSQVIQATAAGKCDVGIINTYYLARAIAKDSSVADNVGIFFANQRTSGTHINISGGGILKSSRNKELAKDLLEWLVSDAVQGRFASVNHEYPVKPSIKLVEPLKSWGKFNKDNRPVSWSGRLQRKSVMLMDRAGYK